MSFPSFARPIGPLPDSDVRYSICTLVSDPREYSEMVESFVGAGFDPSDCEYLYCDNSAGNTFDAFGAYDVFLRTARGKYVILCHQDVLLKFDTVRDLDRIIRKMDRRDPDWALLGNAGGVGLGRSAVCVTHADGRHHNSEVFPVAVQSLDENFIVVKRSAHMALSRDLRGFHFYGTDLCQIARTRGLGAWVVDFHLLHKSTGKIDASFWEAREAVCDKYRRVFSQDYIQTTCTVIPTGRSRWRQQRALFLQIRLLEKSRPSPGGPSEELARLRDHLGFRAYWGHRILYQAAVPFCNLGRSFQKRRALFLHLRALEKHGMDTPRNRREKARLKRELGRGNHFLQWAIYKMVGPWFNLVRSMEKRGLVRGEKPARPDRSGPAANQSTRLATRRENSSGA